MMEDRKLNERESLELIAQMIRNTRRNLDAGGGNMFLLWGYTGVVVTLGVWAALYFTNCTACLWGFWTLPVVGWLLSWWFGRRWRKQQGAKDYTDRVVCQVWQMIGIACCGVAVFATLYQAYGLILPLCAMLVSLGSLLTGIIIRYTLFRDCLRWALPGVWCWCFRWFPVVYLLQRCLCLPSLCYYRWLSRGMC